MISRSISRTDRPILLLIALALVIGGLASACRAPSPAQHHDGPILVVTLDALRADVVGALGGAPGLTPHFDRLASEATWIGRGISSSSWTVPSMASIFTGLQPMQHGALHAAMARLENELITLPEALGELGYRTAGYRSNHWLTPQFGYRQGFDDFRPLGGGKRAIAHLENLSGGRELIWVHILPPHTPYVLRPELLGRLSDPPSSLPDRVRPLDLEPFFDTAVPLPEAERRSFWSLYQLNVAWADVQLGQLLDAARRSGHWRDTLVLVTSDHGEEFGEQGQTGHGGNLGRVLLEVPVALKLPEGLGRSLATGIGLPVGTVRLFATLVEAAGGEPPDGAAPSLFRPSPPGVLSELYLGNGTNNFSWVQDNQQLHWSARFAPSEPDYFAARLASLGGEPDPPPREPVANIFGRLENAFAKALPLSGLERPVLRLERWTNEGTLRMNDPVRSRALARALRSHFLDLLAGRETVPGAGAGPDLSSSDLEQLRSLGYVIQ